MSFCLIIICVMFDVGQAATHIIVMDHVCIGFFRRVGKRKADQSSQRKAKKEKMAKKDPNKPKRPPSAFFVFLYVSLTS